MKYGVSLNKENIILINSAREFDDKHWENLQRLKNSRWVSYPKKKVFISFCEPDRKMMTNLKNALKKSELLQPIVIEDKREGTKDLSDLIIKGINESNYYISILSKVSMTTQWVNQELGYAISRNGKLEIIPIVESTIIHDLKGFINSTKQLPYQFKISGDDKKDRKSFRDTYKEVITYIENSVLKEIQRIKK